jgi:hypothetical protein
MNREIFSAGPHEKVEIIDEKDVNGRFMVKCNICRTFAHAYEKDQAIKDLEKCSCSPNCCNCANLRHSSSKGPAVPVNGNSYDRLHVCPYDGNRWWQANSHFHLWQQVTSDEEWRILNKESAPEWIR